ncbi:hypothetical protein HU200_033659 [Digitaria exilis]|uniref:PDZ domain-containing protein n=1 Tax=Digitaria exilis TaxID=1010633 RepID=A0A835BKY9_9POAL|nr:hypothetical protein HU200_033659 [Digitaria exilis]
MEEEEELEVTSAPVATAKEHASPAISYRFPTPRIASSSRVRRPAVPNVHESSRKLISRGVTRFVLGVSSYIDGKLLKRCSGFVIDWDENTRSGTVFTSAHLICSTSPWDEWSGSGQHEYAPDAEVRVHLGEEIAVRGQLVYYNRHYGFALIGVHMDQPPALLACFSSEEVRYAQDVFVLGRDGRFLLQLSNGKVNCRGPSLYTRYHYMYITGGEVLECCTGGPVVDFDGVVMGMKSYDGFVSCSIINKCLHLWRRFGCIHRLHLGLKLSAIKSLGISAQTEKIYLMSDIVDTGLIVEDVSAGSVAEKHGVGKGDIVKSLNGRCVDTTAALESMLLGMCVDRFDNGHDLDSSMDVTLGMFFTSGSVHGTMKFTVNASNDVEVFARRTYNVSDDQDLSTSSSMSPDEASEDDIW